MKLTWMSDKTLLPLKTLRQDEQSQLFGTHGHFVSERFLGLLYLVLKI